MLCLPCAFWKCMFIQMLFWFSDLESSKLYLSVSWLLEFLDLGFWEWFLSLSCFKVPSTSECFSTQRNSSPIYKWFLQNPVLCHRLQFCAYLAPQPLGPPEAPSLYKEPVQSASMVLGAGSPDSHIALASWRRTCHWTFLPHVPQWMSTTEWLVLAVSFWALRFPAGNGPNSYCK